MIIIVGLYDLLACVHYKRTISSEGFFKWSGVAQQDQRVNATDRLMGWAQAFDELGRLRGA